MKNLRTIIAALAIALGTMAASAHPMSYDAMRNNARFLTDRMAYTLGISSALLDDLYYINYDYICGVNDYLDDVALGYYYDDYMDVLRRRDIALQRLLTAAQWTALMSYDYFYRPITFADRVWRFAIYAFDHRHTHFYYHAPRHYHSYRGGSRFHGMRPAVRHNPPRRNPSFRLERHGSDRNRPGNMDRPGNGNRPGNMDRPGNGNRPGNMDRPGNGNRPGNMDRPGNRNRPGNMDRPGNTDRPGNVDRTDRNGNNEGVRAAGSRPSSSMSEGRTNSSRNNRVSGSTGSRSETNMRSSSRSGVRSETSMRSSSRSGSRSETSMRSSSRSGGRSETSMRSSTRSGSRSSITRGGSSSSRSGGASRGGGSSRGGGRSGGRGR